MGMLGRRQRDIKAQRGGGQGEWSSHELGRKVVGHGFTLANTDIEKG